jgi:hypothetical protein
MANIKSVSGVNYTEWETAFEADLAAQTAHTFVDNTAHNITGVDGTVVAFTPRNVSNASTFALAASGCKIETDENESTTNWYSTIQTGPVLYAALSDIISGYNLKDTICVQVLATPAIVDAGSNGANTVLGSGLTLSDGGYGASGGGNWIISAVYQFLNSSTSVYYGRFGGGSGAGDGDRIAELTGQAALPSFFELVFYPGTGWSMAASTDTTFQDPLSVATARFHGNMETSVASEIGSGGTQSPGTSPAFTLRPNNLNLGMWTVMSTQSGGRSGGVATVFKNLRVLKRS